MLILEAKKREIFGKANKVVRAEGNMPIVAYGPGNPAKESLHYAVPTKEFIRVYREAGESALVGLETPEGRLESVIQDVARDPVTGAPLHADFFLIERGKTMEVTVPFEFVGESPAVKSFGGILMKTMHEVDIEVLPSNIPQEIEVDVSLLATLDDVITIGDLKLPEGVKVLAESDEVVVSVDTAGEDEVEIATEIDFTAIEAEKKGKKEEEVSSE
ncbi:MAG: 50S ribosomal protein L25 [bacterium]|nr:50S ribosomal protein L25 [bacterium]